MYILGLGTNVGNRLQNLRNTLKLLRELDALTIRQVSPVYGSEALLLPDAPDIWDMSYLNCALSCDSRLHPDELVKLLKKVEEKIGRVQGPRWSPRLIDVDILACDNKVYNTERVTIPHKGLTERPFALWPLLDVLPEWDFTFEYEGHEQCAQEIVAKWGSRFEGNAPLHTKQVNFRIDTPQLIGIVNVTPDSMSDGGIFFDPEKAFQRSCELFEAGAEIIDIGAEATNPFKPSGDYTEVKIDPEQEWQRLEPVLKAIQTRYNDRAFKPLISVDTRHASIIEKALAYGIDWINDVTGFDDPLMLEIAKQSNTQLVVMHHLYREGQPTEFPNYNVDIVDDVFQWGRQRLAFMQEQGIANDRLIFDIGMGAGKLFGKTSEQQLTLLKQIDTFKQLNMPLLVGNSRKSFMNLYTPLHPSERDPETMATTIYLAHKQVDYLRVHHVDYNARILRAAYSLFNEKNAETSQT